MANKNNTANESTVQTLASDDVKKFLDYDGLKEVLIKIVNATDTENGLSYVLGVEDGKLRKGETLISQTNDDTYVLKLVDNSGNMLLGFKTTGEIEVPIGLTDDSYILINALYNVLSEAIPALTAYCDTETDSRKALITQSTDNDYVLKFVDAANNLLQGVKKTGEIDIPSGVSDDTYDILSLYAEKLDTIANYLQEVNERLKKIN